MKRWLVLGALLLAACAPPATGPQPPEIAYGHDLCEECGMIISEAKFAAATVLKDGQARKFESIADMMTYHMMEHPDQVVVAWFVHDYNSEKWIDAPTAVYVLSEAINAPMPPGLAAFEEQAEAEAFAATVNGTVLTYDEMRVQVHMSVH